MKLTELALQVASPPDRERCVIEILSGAEQVCEVNDEYGEPVIEIYPNPNGGPWLIDLAALQQALAKARDSIRLNQKH